MQADLVGALEQLDRSWRAFEHKGKPMTKEQVRKALVYGIRKGYTHTGQMSDEDVEKALAGNISDSLSKSRCCGRCDGINDECVNDAICQEHDKQGCEICWPHPSNAG